MPPAPAAHRRTSKLHGIAPLRCITQGQADGKEVICFRGQKLNTKHKYLEDWRYSGKPDIYYKSGLDSPDLIEVLFGNDKSGFSSVAMVTSRKAISQASKKSRVKFTAIAGSNFLQV